MRINTAFASGEQQPARYSQQRKNNKAAGWKAFSKWILKPAKHFSGKRYITSKKKSSASAGLFYVQKYRGAVPCMVCAFLI